MRNYKIVFRILTVSVSLAISLNSQNSSAQDRTELRTKAFVFWQGTRTKMTIKEFASYCAPVFWYSADEPSLKRAKGKQIMIPQNFPFQKSNGRPVVYYQIPYIISRDNKQGPAFVTDRDNFENSIINLDNISGVEIDYNHYYEFEAGLGTHHHDTEQSQFKISVIRKKVNDTTRYGLILIQVTAKAHALPWYDNIYNLDTTALETELPFNIMVEEGKHASCTDVNG